MSEEQIQELIDELPDTFVNPVMQENDIDKLKERLQRHVCYNRRAVIQARIDQLSTKY